MLIDCGYFEDYESTLRIVEPLLLALLRGGYGSSSSEMDETGQQT